ncbi:MAG: hypothetical protein QGG64_04555 [Candidatus Latescibacteria bacterium]|jgi:Mg/Co/Ni transporter MgtE|nr:hypothetical protein [Candidatus Latescibacterota bacterium]
MRPNEFIEEAIEESYLLGLSESEIRTNLDHFIDTCGRVIREHVHDRKQMQALAEKLARARALSLIENHQEGEWGEVIPPQNQDDALDSLAERVARNKRLILRAIAECDPALVERIDQIRFPNRTTTPSPDSYTPPVFQVRPWLVKVGSLIIMIAGLLVAYWILMQYV